MIAAPPAVAALTAFGINLGLHPAVLLAGFAGALGAIVLLGSVPSEGDTWQHLVRTTLRRMAVALVSSLTAGYLTPLSMLLVQMPEPLMLAVAFSIGAGAQRILRGAIDRVATGQPTQQGEGDQP